MCDIMYENLLEEVGMFEEKEVEVSSGGIRGLFGKKEKKKKLFDVPKNKIEEFMENTYKAISNELDRDFSAERKIKGKKKMSDGQIKDNRWLKSISFSSSDKEIEGEISQHIARLKDREGRYNVAKIRIKYDPSEENDSEYLGLIESVEDSINRCSWAQEDSDVAEYST